MNSGSVDQAWSRATGPGHSTVLMSKSLGTRRFPIISTNYRQSKNNHLTWHSGLSRSESKLAPRRTPPTAIDNPEFIFTRGDLSAILHRAINHVCGRKREKKKIFICFSQCASFHGESGGLCRSDMGMDYGRQQLR